MNGQKRLEKGTAPAGTRKRELGDTPRATRKASSALTLSCSCLCRKHFASLLPSPSHSPPPPAHPGLSFSLPSSMLSFYPWRVITAGPFGGLSPAPALICTPAELNRSRRFATWKLAPRIEAVPSVEQVVQRLMSPVEKPGGREGSCILTACAVTVRFAGRSNSKDQARSDI